MRRLLAFLAAFAALGLLAAGVYGVWRLSETARRKPATEFKPIPVAPAPTATPTSAPKLSTIIDLPGDPALVSRAAQKEPRRLTLAVPTKLSPGAPRPESEAFYVNEPLTPAGGGYLGKFVENGQQADSLNAELAMNTGAMAEDMGDDDDGGDATPENAPALTPLTGANSLQLTAQPGGETGQAQLRQISLRPKVAQKISELLIESGYEPDSAHAVEDAAKRLFRIQSLRAGAVALAVGAVTTSGAYRVTQLAMFQDNEYVGTVAIGETGSYEEGAEPALPPGFLDDSDRPPAGAHFNLADGVYSAGLRSAAPEPVIREAVHLLGKLTDLSASLSTGVTLRLIYSHAPRAKGQASRVIYVALAGGGANAECYAFELADGSYRCFTKEDAEPAPLPPSPPPAGGAAVPLPPDRKGGGGAASGGGALADSGANAVGGLLAPIRGAPVTSLFGMRFHPILHFTRLHAGLDFGAAVGSQIRASADGVVESAGEARGYGTRIVLKHGGYETTYNHLSEVKVEVGQKVRQGEIIALSGNSGLSTGPHLHYEYRVNGEPQDPLPHMGKEVQAHAPVGGSGGGGGGGGGSFVPLPPTAARPPPPDPAMLAAFAAAKADIDGAVASADR